MQKPVNRRPSEAEPRRPSPPEPVVTPRPPLEPHDAEPTREMSALWPLLWFGLFFALLIGVGAWLNTVGG